METWNPVPQKIILGIWEIHCIFLFQIHFHKIHFDQSRWWVRTLEIAREGKSYHYQTLYVSLRNVHWMKRIETRKLSQYWHWEVSFIVTFQLWMWFAKNVLGGRIAWTWKKGVGGILSATIRLWMRFAEIFSAMSELRSYNTLIHLRSKSFVK